jgi:hypothetical protein
MPNWISLFVDHDCGHPKDVAARSACIHGLYGVADRASYAILVIWPLFRASLRQRTCRKCYRIMAAFAMAREFDPLFGIKQAHVPQIPRNAIGVRVGGFAPLVLGFAMTAPAVLRGRKTCGIDKLSIVRLHIGREKWLILPIPKIVCRGDVIGVCLTSVRGRLDLRSRANLAVDPKPQDQNGSANGETAYFKTGSTRAGRQLKHSHG